MCAEWIPLRVVRNKLITLQQSSFSGYLTNCLKLVQAFQHHAVQKHRVIFKCD